MRQPLPLSPLEYLMKQLHSGQSSEAELISLADRIENDRDHNFALQVVLGERRENNMIPELNYFSDGDITLSRHLRYMPPNIHSHEFFEVVYLRLGECSHCVEDAVYEMQPGEIFIIPPGTRHYLEIYDDMSEAYNILVRRSTFERAFSGFLRGDDMISRFYWETIYAAGGPRALRINTGERYGELVDRMFDEAGFDGANRILKAFFELLMAYAARDCSEAITPIGSNTDDHLGFALMQHLGTEYATATLRNAARFFGYSEAYFSRLIRRITGLGFSELLRRVRLEKARTLLADTALPVEEVILRVGYASKSHFYRHYRETYGTTPDGDRKRAQA